MLIFPAGLTYKDNYKLLSGAVIPRPIALISTKSEAGNRGINNVAPFSFFNVVSTDPPMVMFVVHNREGQQKDTLVNIRNHPLFVANMVSEPFLRQAHATSIAYLPEIDEFEEAGLTPIRANAIDGIGVAEALVRFECELERMLEIGNVVMIIGRVVCYDIADNVYQGNFKLDLDALKPVGRLSGNRYGLLSKTLFFKVQPDPAKNSKLP